MLFTIQDDSVSPGAYRARFSKFEECDTKQGKAWRWVFEIADGKYRGKSVSELSDASPPTTQNKTGRFLAATSGKTLAVGTSVDPDTYIGDSYTIMVEAKGNGKTRIASFSKVAADDVDETPF